MPSDALAVPTLFGLAVCGLIAMLVGDSLFCVGGRDNVYGMWLGGLIVSLLGASWHLIFICLVGIWKPAGLKSGNCFVLTGLIVLACIFSSISWGPLLGCGLSFPVPNQ